MGVGGGPSLTQAQNTMTTSVTKTRPSVRSSRSFHLPFASAFGAGGGNNPTQQPPGHAHGAMSSLSNRTTKSGKLNRLFTAFYHPKFMSKNILSKTKPSIPVWIQPDPVWMNVQDNYGQENGPFLVQTQIGNFSVLLIFFL